MANFAQNTFNLNFKDIILEEVCLEGLEGAGIDLLWRQIENRISSPVTEKMQCRYWEFIIKCNEISVYVNPEPMPHREILDRFVIIDEESGDLKEPDDLLDGPYEYCPIEGEYGSCVHYKTRIPLDKHEIENVPYKKLLEKYGSNLVLVGSKEARWAALVPHLPISYISQLTTVHYCILELVGRSRENGQMTTGKTNLTKIVKDPKLLFYNRKVLQKMDCIKTCNVTHVTTEKWQGAVRGTKGILLRLKRFHKSLVQTIPKVGMIHNLVEYLRAQPNFTETTDSVMNKGLLTQKQNKKFQKKSTYYIFGFGENPLAMEESSSKKRSSNFRRRSIFLCPHSDESSQSEDEETVTPRPCQYKVGVNVLRQAYEAFLNAGLDGLTQIELGQVLGIEFYISRSICRMFKTKNLVREFLEDRGRQRTARFIAIAATAKKDIEYAAEKEKFKQYMKECKDFKKEKVRSPPDSDADIPKKRIKSEPAEDEHVEEITEAKYLDGMNSSQANISLSDPSKKLTLRQLKFANGVLKVVHDNNFVTGYLNLSRLVSKEINEPPMVSKALKVFLQRLTSDGFIKLLSIKWPNVPNQCTTLICAPHVKPTDPAVKALYKDITKKSARRRENYAKQVLRGSKPLTHYAYPRFMKVQKLHQFLAKRVLFDAVNSEPNDVNKGFIHIKDIIHNLTVEDALGNISSAGFNDIAKFSIDKSSFSLKICDAPTELSKALINSKHLCNTIRSNLTVLALFGLVQFVAHESIESAKIPSQCLAITLFYVNQYGSLVDTSGIWPRSTMHMQDMEKTYHFKTVEDVTSYWSTMMNISSTTSIDVPDRKTLKQPKVPIRQKGDVRFYDNGQRFGNGLGPCGMDSMFFLDFRRLWSAYSIRSNNPPKQVKPPVQIPKFDRVRIRKRKTKKTKPKPRARAKKEHYDEEFEKLPAIKYAQVKKTSILKRSLMRTAKYRNTVEWTHEEDRIAMICKLAMSIMSPFSQPGSLQVRNIVARDVLSIKDPNKTQRNCHRRTVVTDCNSTLTYEKDCLRAELKHINVIKEYEGLLKKLRIQFSTYMNMSKYVHMARLRLLELVWIIFQVFERTHSQRKIPVFENINAFRKRYSLVLSSSNQTSHKYRSAPDDIIMGPLKEAILFTVMSSTNTAVIKKNAAKIFRNFERYDESTLRKAVEQMRKCGAIITNDKMVNLLGKKANLEDLVQCWYKISMSHQRKWSVRLNTEFADDVATSFKEMKKGANIKGTPDVNCVSFELQTTGVLDVYSMVDPLITGSSGTVIQEDHLNPIDIETKFKLKSSVMGWTQNSDYEAYADSLNSILDEDPFDYILRHSIIENEPEVVVRSHSKVEKCIITHLTNKKEKGATYHELQKLCGCENKELVTILTKLNEDNVIKRVGVYENYLVLIEYFKSWSMIVDEKHVLTKPWLTIQLKISYDIFFKWAGVIMNKIFEYPGSTITHISDSCEYLSTAAVQDVCYVLWKWKCINLQIMTFQKPDLFLDCEDLIPELRSFNEYESPQNIYAFPVTDSLVKYCVIRNILL